jgi:magnesium-transporting ATPase (P-type)
MIIGVFRGIAWFCFFLTIVAGYSNAYWCWRNRIQDGREIEIIKMKAYLWLTIIGVQVLRLAGSFFGPRPKYAAGYVVCHAMAQMFLAVAACRFLGFHLRAGTVGINPHKD